MALFEGLEMGESGIRFSPALHPFRSALEGLSSPPPFLGQIVRKNGKRKRRGLEGGGVGGGSGTERITAFPH